MPISRKNNALNSFPIPLARPYLTSGAQKNIQKCFTENFYSQGFFNTQFEREFAAYHHMKYATTCSNGTAALWLALKAFGIGAGDEVIVPTLTFAATVGAVVAVGATPVFVDSIRKDGTISPEGIANAITSRTKAVIAVDLYGLSADYTAIRKAISGTTIALIQDAAEGLGGTYKGKPLGTQGDISCFSFFGNKILTTGEGGMCMTQSKELYDAMVLLKNHGTSNKAYWVEVPGFNMRMTNLQAGIGVSQLAAFPRLLTERYRIFETYMSLCAKVPTLSLLPFVHKAYAPWLFALQVPGMTKKDVIEKLGEQGIEARPSFYPLHRTPAFRAYVKGSEKFPVADAFSEHLINIPTFIGLKKSDCVRIVNALAQITSSHE